MTHATMYLRWDQIVNVLGYILPPAMLVCIGVCKDQMKENESALTRGNRL